MDMEPFEFTMTEELMHSISFWICFFNLF